MTDQDLKIPEKPLSISELSHFLGVSVSTVRRYKQHGDMKFIRLGPGGSKGNYIVFPEEVRRFLVERSMEYE